MTVTAFDVITRTRSARFTETKNVFISTEE